ncbi:MAG: xanthine dehydrogenase small subunit [Alphaproteobacteria bacterium]|nr:xanthine dehydrogenase small subunit [Alphaproteobacteria bacterium]
MRDHIRFILGDATIELRDIDPTMTVLDWLRLEQSRAGTKEGCAEGDCGACTVVIARPENGGLSYRAVNGCIVFMPMLDGCQLLTVEDLKNPDGALHAVQQSMVDCHGSQCGFCTPGFVMSLFALYRNEENPTDQRIDDVLAGNLCRCTGYAPIAAAAKQMYSEAAPSKDRFAAGEAQMVARLEALADDETLCVGSENRQLFAPANIDGLADILAENPDACIVAGGTDVGLWVTKQLRDIVPAVLIGRVAELRRIEETGDAIIIGAGVTYNEASSIITAHYPDFGELIRRIGGQQVRNMGTIGGNVANGSPIGDSPPALIAAGATLGLRLGSEQRTILLEDFFIDYGKQDRRPGEFVEYVVLPKPEPGTQYRCYKISKRFDQDISAACGAFRLRLDGDIVADIRIAFGGMAATPKRAAATEAALTGKPWTEETIEAALDIMEQDYTPLTDWRASAWYRMAVAKNLLRKFHAETSGPAAPIRLVGDGRLAHA